MKKYFSLLTALLVSSLPVFSAGTELLTNRDFAKSANGVPNDWRFQKQPAVTSYKLNPAPAGGVASVTIKTANANSKGFLQFQKNVNIKAGSLITVSGEYRTSELTFSKGGSAMLTLMFRTGFRSDKEAKFWHNVTLNPTDKWTKFSKSARAKYDLKSLSLNAGLWNAKGHMELRNISVKVEAPVAKPAADSEFVWREAEDIDRIERPSNWGADIAKDYFSGRGGIAKDQAKIDWTFQIAPVTDPYTLNSKKRTWYLWARVYGYLESPRVMIYRNDKFLAYIDTPSTEKSNKKGKYAGPGKYVWVLCGQFTTTGGMQQISFRPKGRMLIDAIMMTTDAKYAPVKFEAKNFPAAKVDDIATTNMIKAEYVNEGISDKVTLPISFRIGGKRKSIPVGGKPAIFHFTLPADIAVKEVASHFAGTDWSSDRWKNRFLTWKKVATRNVRGKQVCDYEASLYYLASNQYLVYAQADPKTFKSRKESICEYYLECDGEKQLKESIALKHIDIKTTTPFKKIYIGPSYVPLKMIYHSYPDVYTNMKACGLNYMGSWFTPWKDQKFFDEYRNKAYANNFMVTVVVPQYTGVKPQHIAIGIDGKPISSMSGQGTKVLTLAMDENDAPIKGTLERTRLAAATGCTVEYDDEMTNVLWDKIDYSPKVKKLFKEWLAKERPGVAYKEPELIVRDKAKDPVMYNHWVNFKCSRIAYWYSLYRKAFDEGLALAKGKYPEHMKPKLMTCVQGLVKRPDGKPSTAETVKESGFLDYRLLNKYCDIIQIMCYTYNGIRGSARPGHVTEVFNRYLGKCNTVPILLAGGYGTEVTMENKDMLKYEVWESLMQKPKLIIFYAGATLFNAPTLAPVVEAIRIARPFEDFFVDGERYESMKAASGYVRVKALKIGSKVLLYAGNYDNAVGKKERVDFPVALKSVKEINSGKMVKVDGKGFTFDFKASRGKFFLVEL